MSTTRAKLHPTTRGSNAPRGYLIYLWLQLAAALGVTPMAAAASLQEVQAFGNNPSNARMFVYVPDRVAASPPVLVAIHYCSGTASAYFMGTGYRALADQHGFIVVYPQATSSDGCFDVHSDATLKRDGGSDSAAIVSMVRFAISMYGADANRVYVTGTSSGAMMTNVLLGAYPDVFKGGAAFAGVPYGCFAGPNAWSSDCANGQITKTAQQWGELVRAAYPGYAGARPRVQLWHGDQDETLNFHNFGEEIKEWTNVLGVSETPSTTEQNAPQAGWTRTRYTDAGGIVRVEAVLEAGMTHNLSVPAAEVIRFFGLDMAFDPAGSAANGGSGALAGAGNAGASVASSTAGQQTAAGISAAGHSGKASVGEAGGAGTAALAGAGTGGNGQPSPAIARDQAGTGGVAGASELPRTAAGAAASGGGSSVMPDNEQLSPSHQAETSCAVLGLRPGPGGASMRVFMLGVLAWQLARSRRRRATR